MRTHEDFGEKDEAAVAQLATEMLSHIGREVEPFVLLTALLVAHRHVVKQLPLGCAKTAAKGACLYGNHLASEFSARQEASPSPHIH